MWMNRHVRDAACGARKNSATRPSQTLTHSWLDSERWLASWATVKSRYDATAFASTESAHGQLPVSASAVEPANSVTPARKISAAGTAIAGTGSSGRGIRVTE